jgi:ABC-type branched-subunit amino acid transport system substrate-binding protein
LAWVGVWLWGAAAWSQEAPKGYKLGVLVPLSGKQEKLGEAILDAVNFAQVEHGALEVVIGDTRGTPEGAREQVEALALDPAVVAILGDVGWDTGRAGASRAQELGIPIVSLSAEEGVERLGGYVFRGRVSVQEQARLMARVGVKDLQLERFAILYPDDRLGTLAAEAFFEEVRRLGGRVMSLAEYPTGTTNFTESVELLVGMRGYKLAGVGVERAPKGKVGKLDKVSKIEFQALFLPGYDEEAALAVKFLRFLDVPLSGASAGYEVQILGTSHLPGPRLLDDEGLLVGALYPEVFHPEKAGDASRSLSARFEEAFGREPSDLEAQVVDLHWVLRQMFEGCAREGLTVAQARERLPARLSAMEPAQGLTGLLWFGPERRPKAPLEVWIVSGGGALSPSY